MQEVKIIVNLLKTLWIILEKANFLPLLPCKDLVNALLQPVVTSLERYLYISGVASVDNWRGEYSYIRVHKP